MCHDGLLTQVCSNKWRQNEKARGHNYFSTWNKNSHTRSQIKYKLQNVFCTYILHCCSVNKSCLTLGPHELQHASLPCPSLSLGVYSNSCASSWWYYPTISSSAVLFSFCLQSFPASGSFPMSQLFTSRGQSIAASASSSVLPVNIQGWFPLGLTGLISLPSKGLSRVFSNTTFESINSLVLSLLYGPTLTSIHEDCKSHSFDYKDLCW